MKISKKVQYSCQPGAGTLFLSTAENLSYASLHSVRLFPPDGVDADANTDADADAAQVGSLCEDFQPG